MQSQDADAVAVKTCGLEETIVASVALSPIYTVPRGLWIERNVSAPNDNWVQTRVFYGSKLFMAWLILHDGEVYIKPGEFTDEHGKCCRMGPNRGYHWSEYEQLFGFGGHCEGFDPNVVTCLRKERSA
jgi:hypothetical protein